MIVSPVQFGDTIHKFDQNVNIYAIMFTCRKAFSQETPYLDMYSENVKHLMTTKMLRKGRASMTGPQQEESRFTMAKAMVLASTDLKQRTAINSAASFLMDGHSVDISKELVEQKPSIVRSQEWTTTVFESPQSQATPGIIRVCWQCPETSSALNSRTNLAATLVRD